MKNGLKLLLLVGGLSASASALAQTSVGPGDIPDVEVALPTDPKACAMALMDAAIGVLNHEPFRPRPIGQVCGGRAGGGSDPDGLNSEVMDALNASVAGQVTCKYKIICF